LKLLAFGGWLLVLAISQQLRANSQQLTASS
jgi:hypothetical protein